jgi:nicotinamidase-related amidase
MPVSEPDSEAGPRVGWVVDVQNDFMRPDGRLYVQDPDDDDDPGADAALGAIEAAVEWMRHHCDVVVFTGDWHGFDDDEIDAEDPDPAKGTYPPHCLGRSEDPRDREGAHIVDEVRPTDPVVLEIGASEGEARAVALTAVAEGRPILVHKNRFDVFEGNDSTSVLVEALTVELGEEPTFWVAGVARDVCVTGAVDGLQDRSYPVAAIRDATWGLGLEAEEETLARWRDRGARIVSTGELPDG